jgi:nucleotide-binding universal stress UspA family protein
VKQLQRVLCAIDLSDLSAAPLKTAATIQRWFGSFVTVLHVVPTFDALEVHNGGWFDPVSIAYSRTQDEVVEKIRDISLKAGIPQDRVRFLAVAGQPAAEILDQAAAARIELIIIGTNGLHGIDRLLLGSVADTVLRRATCDVLSVPPRARREPARFATIVCGVDFSQESVYAVRAAFALADRVAARVVLVHAVEWLPEEQPADAVDFNVSDFRARLVHDAQRRLGALVVEESPLARAVRVKAVSGRAYREILRVATEERADLIAVGHRGRSRAAVPLLGSTVDGIVRGASCPVLTIRAPHERVDACSAPAVQATAPEPSAAKT